MIYLSDEVKNMVDQGLWIPQEEVNTEIDLNPPSQIFVGNDYFSFTNQ